MKNVRKFFETIANDKFADFDDAQIWSLVDGVTDDIINSPIDLRLNYYRIYFRGIIHAMIYNRKNNKYTLLKNIIYRTHSTLNELQIYISKRMLNEMEIGLTMLTEIDKGMIRLVSDIKNESQKEDTHNIEFLTPFFEDDSKGKPEKKAKYFDDFCKSNPYEIVKWMEMFVMLGCKKAKKYLNKPQYFKDIFVYCGYLEEEKVKKHEYRHEFTNGIKAIMELNN